MSRCISGLDFTMVLGGSIDHSDWDGPRDSIAFGYKHEHQWHSRPQTFVWPLVATWIMNVSKDPECSRTVVLGSSSGPDISMDLDEKQSTHISLFLTTFASSVPPLSTAHD